jgi:hypothetical protein
MSANNMNPGGSFTLPGTSITLNRLGRERDGEHIEDEQ